MFTREQSFLKISYAHCAALALISLLNRHK